MKTIKTLIRTASASVFFCVLIVLNASAQESMSSDGVAPMLVQYVRP